MQVAINPIDGSPFISRRAEICGVQFDLISRDEVVERIRSWRRTGSRGYVTFVNPYSVYLCKEDPEMELAVRNSHMTLPDGIGIVISADLLRYKHCGRLSGPEMMLHICDVGRQFGLSHYFLGGAVGIAERLAAKLKRKYPGLVVAGWCAPPFHELTHQEDAQIIAGINSVHPDLLWVGLGAPKQEKWIARHLWKIDTVAMIGVGAAFDFHSGNVPWCPASVRRMGLEWAYRLIHQPKKLWPRYLALPPFLGALARQWFRERKRVKFNGRSGGRSSAAPISGSDSPDVT